MRNIFIIIILFLILSTRLFSQKDPNCDSSNIKGFQNNLILIKDRIPKFLIDTAETIVNKKVEQLRLSDSTLGKINLKTYLRISKLYKVSNKYLFLLGFALIMDSSNIDYNSAQIFVFGIYNENKINYCDEMDELEGEIKMELNGYEEKDRAFKIYGKAFPYFGSNYGRFILSEHNDKISYKWECTNRNP